MLEAHCLPLDMIKNNKRYSEQEIADSRSLLHHEIKRLGYN